MKEGENRSRPIGYLHECAVQVAQRIGKRMDSITDSSVREVVVWTDGTGAVFASRSDSASAMQAEMRTGVIGVYRFTASRRKNVSTVRVDMITDDIREEQRLRSLAVAA